MNKIFGWKQVLTGLLILMFIFFIYAINTDNQAALMISLIILSLFMLLESIWVIKAKEYKTIYWIAIANMINVATIIGFVILKVNSRNVAEMDIHEMSRQITLRDGLMIAFYISVLARTFLKSEIFKITKDLSEDKPRDI